MNFENFSFSGLADEIKYVQVTNNEGVEEEELWEVGVLLLHR